MKTKNIVSKTTAKILKTLQSDKLQSLEDKNYATQWIEIFLNQNSDLIERVSLSHLIGMLVTNANFRVKSVNIGDLNVPNYKEAIGFLKLWLISKNKF